MAQFKTRARALDLLGRQQIAGIPTAINELIKNAHDAYADKFDIDFLRCNNLLVLRDDGLGMTKEEFETRWLTLGTESKPTSFKFLFCHTEAGVAQMRAASHQVEASLMDLKRQVRETENSLAVLLAKAPQTIDRNTLDEQVMPEELTAGVPLQLLENRPDVKMAEMTLAAAYYTTNSARAAFYPGLNITGTAGWTNGSGISVVNPGEFMLQALASLAQPIFNNGKLVANLKVSKAEEKIAKMNYQQTILEAGKEVSDALFLYDTQNKKLIEDRGQVEQLDKAVTYTKALFQSGEATYLEILTAQQNLLSAQLSEVSDNFQRMQAVINLYSALGGGRE